MSNPKSLHYDTSKIVKKSEQIKIWQENQKFRISREIFWKPKIYAVLQGVIRDATNYPSAELIRNHLNISINKIPLNNLIQDIYIDAGRVMGGRAYQQVKKQAAGMEKALMPIGYNEQLVNDIILYFQNYLLDKVVLPITETMKLWILKYVIDQQLTGKSIPMIVDEMVKHDFPKNRAFVIVRTEVLRAANYGAVQGAKRTGFQAKKVWISAIDNRTRRIPRDAFNHIAMNGITVNMDEPFQVPRRSGGIETLLQPGDPNGSAADVIQCRCTVGFEVQRGKDGRPLKISA